MTSSNSQQRKGRRMLLLLVVLFSLPVLAVIGMYLLDYRPGGSSLGELLTPPRALALVPAATLRGPTMTPEAWKKKWHFVVLARTGCDAKCQERVHLVRQIHVSLNKEIDRVERVLIVTDASDRSSLEQLQARYPDLHILAGKDALSLAGQFQQGTDNNNAENVYVVDPLGNLVMRYPPGFDPKGMLHDMTRLLKYSWVG